MHSKSAVFVDHERVVETSGPAEKVIRSRNKGCHMTGRGLLRNGLQGHDHDWLDFSTSQIAIVPEDQMARLRSGFSGTKDQGKEEGGRGKEEDTCEERA